VTTAVWRHWAAFDGAMVYLDAFRDAIAAESPAHVRRRHVRAGPRDLCYVICTSASPAGPRA
jgi:hypothetical protein